MAWTDEMVNDLRKMWAEGLTTGEIGKRLGVSKNSIVGKVHRLGLSGRPSPIKKKEESQTPAAAKPAKAPEEKKIKPKAAPTPAPAPKKEAPKAETPKTEPDKKVFTAPKIEEKTEVQHQPQPVKQPQSHGGKTMLVDLDNHTCRWPLGDPKDENFHFCGRKIHIGQTYCEEHANIAYVKTTGKK